MIYTYLIAEGLLVLAIPISFVLPYSRTRDVDGDPNLKVRWRVSADTGGNPTGETSS
jgi:hypothetical protein